MTLNDSSSHSNELPTIDLIYNFVPHVYNWTLSRLETVERRIQNYMTFMTMITFTIPITTVAFAGDRIEASLWLIPLALAGVCFLLGSLQGLLGLWGGFVHYASLDNMYCNQRDDVPATFKLDTVRYAVQHRTDNSALINKKANAAMRVGALSLLELLLGATWAVSVFVWGETV